MKWTVVVVALAGGIYVLHWMHNAEIGAALIGLAGVLTDPTPVIDAVKAWKGAK